MTIYSGLDRESCRPKAIKVERIPNDTSEELLSLIFENQRRSGGGEIEQLDYDTEENTAVIVFKEADSEYILIVVDMLRLTAYSELLHYIFNSIL